jgi:prepilin-type N-terminal cleavage/methylation domain-containing protein
MRIKSIEQPGFTLVELIITIVVAGIFIAIISQMNSSVVNIATNAHRFEIASSLAYNNLRIYANGQKPTWFDCIGDESGETSAPFTDGKTYPSATGKDILSSTAAVANLPSPVTQTVNVLAPYGCGQSAGGMPIRVVSTVTYGSPAKKVVHATYVGY